MLMRFYFLLLCALPLPLGAQAPISTQQHATLRAAQERNDPQKAEQLLREWQRINSVAFTQNNYDYLLARLLHQRFANAEATALYAQVITRNSPLAAYALWHQAEIARANQKLQEEQTYLQKLLGQYPEFMHRERARRRLADSFFNTGNYTATLTTLRALGPRRDSLPDIGKAQAGLKDYAAARSTFAAALVGERPDDIALAAILELDKLDTQGFSGLTEAEHLRRARVLHTNRFFPQARAHWQAILTQFPASKARAEALFQMGRAFGWEENYAAALPYYERVGAEFPNTEEGEQGFYYVGHCHQFLGQADKAVAQYEAYFRQYPKGKFIGYGHLNATDTLRNAGRLDEALQWALRTQTNNPEAFFVVTGLFNQAKIRLSKNDYTGALADLSALRLKNLNVRGQIATTNLPEVNFLRAYCLEQLGRYDEAATEYLALPEFRQGAIGFYAARATERLRAWRNNPKANDVLLLRRGALLAQLQAAQTAGDVPLIKATAQQALRLVEDKTSLLETLRRAYAQLPGYQPPAITFTPAGRLAPLPPNATSPTSPNGNAHLTIANELLFLGLYDEGASELAAARTASQQTVAYYCAKGDCADFTYRVYEPSLRALPEDFRLELLAPLTAEVLYPFPFRDELNQHARSRRVDPRFVLSIARQESSYNPRVKSAAAARGLLQFIAPTALQITSQLGLHDFAQDDLYDPHTAILCGSQYMKNLFDEFGWATAVAASYNGGEDSVRRWVARMRGQEADRFVSEIAKRETKDYVFKVLNNYRAYQTVYPNAR